LYTTQLRLAKHKCKNKKVKIASLTHRLIVIKKTAKQFYLGLSYFDSRLRHEKNANLAGM